MPSFNDKSGPKTKMTLKRKGCAAEAEVETEGMQMWQLYAAIETWSFSLQFYDCCKAPVVESEIVEVAPTINLLCSQSYTSQVL